MNIYNLSDFRCVACKQWFHPTKNPPMLLPCCDSICTSCLAKGVRACPGHQDIPTSQARTNIHIQKALERLMKNISGSDADYIISSINSLIESTQSDRQALVSLLDRLYQNQINRITYLRKRVLRQLRQPYEAFEDWKRKISTSKTGIMQQGKRLQKRWKEYSKVDFQGIVQRLIEDTSICLQRHFSVFNMNQQKTTKNLQNSVINQKNNNFHSILRRSIDQKQNHNFYLNCVKTVDSPQRSKVETCKQLSSFKLPDHHYEISIIENNPVTHKQSQHQSQPTRRDIQQSKCSMKTKITNQEKQIKERPGHDYKPSFADLVNSLKSNSDLQYSLEMPEEQSLLLEEPKQEKVLAKSKSINFLKEFNVDRQRKSPQLEIKQRLLVDCEKQKNKYIRRLQCTRTDQAVKNSHLSGNSVQLFNFDLKEVDLAQYFSKFDWSKIQIVKLVASGLQDFQFNQLLNCLLEAKVHTLLLPGNDLQEISLDALVNFTELNSHLKTVSLQRNNIHSLQTRSRRKIAELKKRGVTLYI